MVLAVFVNLFPERSIRYGVLIQFKPGLTLPEQIAALEQWMRQSNGDDFLRHFSPQIPLSTLRPIPAGP